MRALVQTRCLRQSGGSLKWGSSAPRGFASLPWSAPPSSLRFFYGVFMAETWNASSTVPRLDQDDGKIATGLALVAGAATLAVWTYFLTGLAAATTWQFNKDVAP